MPFIDAGDPPLAFFEFWPPPLFYLPVAAFWLFHAARYGSLTLPTVANLGFPAGGLTGESKRAVYAAFGALARSLVPPLVWVTKGTGLGATRVALANAIAGIDSAGLALPLVAKPDIGCRGAGVRRVRTIEELEAYIASFPEGAEFILQRLVTAEGEAGVFYIRRPDEARCQIPSLTLKYFPYVTGDGKSTVGELIRRDRRAGRIARLFLERHKARLHEIPADGERFRLVFSGNHARGTIFRDGTHLVTEALRARMDEIAKDVAGFHFGRFDVRFSDFGAFLRGEDITILELNGAGAEQTHFWDCRNGIGSAYATLFSQYAKLFEIADANRRRGARPLAVRDLKHYFDVERRLKALYPPTE